jgi:hypothetical protein
MECCSFIRKSETMSFAVRLEKLGNIMTHKDKFLRKDMQIEGNFLGKEQE